MSIIILWIGLLLASHRTNEVKAEVDFKHDVQPILQQRCTPCHFPGGVMYARLPFDEGKTIVKLGEKKVFTRIRDERERAVIRAFLSKKANS